MTITIPTNHRPIPGPRGLPFLGVMPEMVSDMLGLFTNTASTYGGIAQFKLLHKNYTLHGHKLRLFTLREAQFVTGGIIFAGD